MRYIRTGLGVLAVLVFMAASGAMNAHFWLSQGKTELEGQILAAVSLAGDLFKSMLPFFIASAFAGRRYIQGIVGSALFLLILCFSLMSSLGFAASNRGAVSGSREAISARYEAVKTELAELDMRISKIADIQDTQIVEAEIDKLKQDVKWTSSKACNDATAPKSRDFCQQYFDMQAKLAAANAGKLLIERQAELRQQAVVLRDHGAGQASDPQASLLAKLIPVGDATLMQMVVIVLITVMVELVAAFGMWLAVGGIARGEKKLPAESEPQVLMPAPRAMTRSRRQRNEHLSQSRAVSTVVLSMAEAKISKPERFRLEDAEALLQAPAG
jgi:hypothetical protein